MWLQRRDGPGRPQPGGRVRGHEHVRQLRAALFSQVLPLWVDWFDWPAAILLCALGFLFGAVTWLPIHPDRVPDPQVEDYDDRPAR